MLNDAYTDLLAGQDFSHLTEALEWLTTAGYHHEFSLERDGLVDLDTKKKYLPSQLRFDGQYRFEGASDPADSSEVFAVMADDGTRGSLVVAYGAKHSGPVGIISEIEFSYQH